MVSMGYAGGAIYFDGGVIDIVRTVFRENSVPGSGDAGALLLCGNGTITSSTFANNVATAGVGGAIQQTCTGNLSVTQSVFSGNTATDGGALELESGSWVTVTNSTFFQNAVVNGQGSAIRSFASTTFLNLTVAQNTGGASLYSNGDLMRLGNTIVQGANGTNCDMGEGGMWLNSLGHNLFSDASCLSLVPSDVMNTDAQLDPRGLDSHGGNTPSIALMSTSPAIDAGDDVLGIVEDQRGVTRPVGEHVDIGAYESDSLVTIPATTTADILVTTLADRDNGECLIGDCSLREAIIYSLSGQSIGFAPELTGVIDITSLGSIEIGHDVTIIGPGVNTLTITGLYPGSLMYIDPEASTIISGLTFASADAMDDGGAIQNNGSLTISDSVFRGNVTGGAGGAVADNGDALIIRNSSFIGNTSQIVGGGVYTDGVAFTSTSSTFTGNTGSAVGGGVHSEGGPVTIRGSAFYGNGAFFAGGGIYSSAYGDLSITDSAFGVNMAIIDGGGAVYHDVQGLTVSNSSFIGNDMSAGAGGAIDAEGETARIAHSTFIGNASGDDGGAIVYCVDSNMTVSDSLFYDNHAMNGGNGGGMAVSCTSITTVTDSTFSANNAWRRGGAMYLQTDDAPVDTISGTTFVGNQSINENAGALNHSGTGDLTLSRDAFRDNFEVNGYYGGAIFAEGETIHIDNTSFERNVGYGGGGAIILNAHAVIDHSSDRKSVV